MTYRVFQIFLPLLVILFHLVALIQFLQKLGGLSLPEKWNGQFLFLLTFSLILALLLPLLKNKGLIYILIGLRSLLLLVMGLPQDGYLDVEFTLTTIMIVETFTYMPLGLGIAYSLVFTGVMVGVQGLAITAWGTALRVPTVIDLWSFGGYGGLTILLCALIRYQNDHQKPVAELKRSYQELLYRLGEINLQLQEYAATVEQETLINERKRISREIHDTLGYTLTNLVMMLEAAKVMLNGTEGDLYHQLEQASRQAGDGLTEVRRALQALRPAQLCELNGLLAIKRLVAAFTKATEIEVILQLGNVPLHFGDETDLVIYRFVQEGITNALRHGHATKIEISFTLVESRVHIQIRDNGVGVDGPKIGYGLAGMRERIERLGGTLAVFSQPGSGFRLLAIIPL